MENASNALIMAATILIGVLIISAGAFLFNQFGENSKTINERMEQAQKDQINAQFVKFEGVETCTAHDIVSVANLAKEYNKNNELTIANSGESGSYYIQVTVKASNSDNSVGKLSNFEDATQENYQNFMKKYSLTDDNNQLRFTCKSVTINDKTGYVSNIVFEQNN